MQQSDFFDKLPKTRLEGLPEGFRYQEDLIGEAEERALLRFLRTLPLQPFDFHGHSARRRVLSFGWRYDFAQARLQPAEALPELLLPLRAAVAAFAGLPVESLEQLLVTEYEAGAGIGWHRDKAVFERTLGLSLLAPCTFRLRRRQGEGWQRAKLEAAPRSVYLLEGAARWDWEHSIPPVPALRYSLTFRTRRRPSGAIA